LAVYREKFRPSDLLDKPRAMAAMTVICADTDEEAALISSSLDQSFVAFRTGGSGRLNRPVPGFPHSLPPADRAMLQHMRQAGGEGSPGTVRREIERFVERTQADEPIIAGNAWDPKARQRSLQLTMAAMR